MSEAFSKAYARYYDLFYSDKDYEEECNFLEGAFHRFATTMPRSLLDLGCGSGGHAIPLAKRGYVVEGVDPSEGMVELARAKALSSRVEASFHVQSAQNLSLGREFDVAICMFNALDYILSDEELLKSLANIRTHLKPGSLFVFDFRNGFPSVTSYSPHRVKWIEDHAQRILRISTTTVNALEHMVETLYECIVFQQDKVVDRFFDRHHVRFFFPREMRRFLETSGFQVLHMCPFPDLDGVLDLSTTWNIAVVAQAY